jgi:hypothetical protein
MSIDWTRRQTGENRAQQALAEAQERAREERNRLLAETDWMMLSDAPLSEQERADAAAWRQSLRDVTAVPFFGKEDLPKPPSSVAPKVRGPRGV